MAWNEWNPDDAQVELGLKMSQDGALIIVDQDGKPVRGVRQFWTNTDAKGRLVLSIKVFAFDGGEVIKP